MVHFIKKIYSVDLSYEHFSEGKYKLPHLCSFCGKSSGELQEVFLQNTPYGLEGASSSPFEGESLPFLMHQSCGNYVSKYKGATKFLTFTLAVLAGGAYAFDPDFWFYVFLILAILSFLITNNTYPSSVEFLLKNNKVSFDFTSKKYAEEFAKINNSKVQEGL